MAAYSTLIDDQSSDTWIQNESAGYKSNLDLKTSDVGETISKPNKKFYTLLLFESVRYGNDYNDDSLGSSLNNHRSSYNLELQLVPISGI
mgnify:FL=1